MELQTTRLILKPTTKKDFDILFKIITNEYVRKYLFDNQVLNKDQVGEFLTKSINSFQSKHYGLWLMSRKNELDKIIGFVGLWDFFEEPQPQLLYALFPENTGQGFASEASNEIMRYSLHNLGLKYLTLSCDTPNMPSHKVAERIGMKKFKEELINGKPLTFYKIELRYQA